MVAFIVDADVIIWCARHKKLNKLFKDKKIIIPEIIYNQVKYRIDRETGEKKPINLERYIENGCLEIVDDPLIKDVEEIIEKVGNCPELTEIHHGEAECILLLNKNKNYKFCTGEIGVLKVLGFLQLSDQAISLEDLIGSLRELRKDFTRECLDNNLKIGSELFVKYGDWE